jgi:hypothetical protein
MMLARTSGTSAGAGILVSLRMSPSSIDLSLHAQTDDDARALPVLFHAAAAAAREAPACRTRSPTMYTDDAGGVHLRCPTRSASGCMWLERCMLRVESGAAVQGCRLTTRLETPAAS